MTELMLVVAPVAQEDLRNIYLHGMRTWGEQQASDYLDHVRDCFWQLTTHPDIGVSRPELGQHLRSFVVKQHVVSARGRHRYWRLFGYSAHADQKGLLGFVTRMRDWPSQVRIVHGETSAKHEFGERLKALYTQAQRNLELSIPSGANE